jgi:dipeptidase
MCDTFVAVGEATSDGCVILAKNSDRHPNESHMLVHLPRAPHEPGSSVRCTYIDVPQVPETYEVLLSKPSWIWGCEKGANEHGVAIGNEAVFTKEPYDKDPGLIGMDMIRLALEQASTAEAALEVIIQLLETFGQGGNCGYLHKEYYHNAFIIADPQEAWVLETAGRFWAAEKVRGVRTISNGLTIGNKWDRASPGLVQHAVEKGWCRSDDEFHFARCYSDFLYTNLDGCRPRQRRSTELLERSAGSVTVETMMTTLRDHGPRAEADPDWNPGRGLLMDTLCVHASLGPTRPSQSTGAMVAHLSAALPTFWLTGTSGTCTGVFKPVFLGGAGLPDLGPSSDGHYDPETLWWSHERLHRAVIRDYPTRHALYAQERADLEAEFIQEADSLRDHCTSNADPGCAEKLGALTASCFDRAAQATEKWVEAVSSAPVQRRPSPLFSLAWWFANRQAGFD